MDQVIFEFDADGLLQPVRGPGLPAHGPGQGLASDQGPEHAPIQGYRPGRRDQATYMLDQAGPRQSSSLSIGVRGCHASFGRSIALLRQSARK